LMSTSSSGRAKNVFANVFKERVHSLMNTCSRGRMAQGEAPEVASSEVQDLTAKSVSAAVRHG
jgi:hypothetical protein